MKPGLERLDVTTEELEALLESVREPLGEGGYQKTESGDPPWDTLIPLAPACQNVRRRAAGLQTPGDSPGRTTRSKIGWIASMF